MTNEQEKSDLFIVAMKLANKPGRSGAESVEPRKRTEGNTGEQHTCRTQSRESVSQGLAWVRGAARGASTLITRGGSPVRELRTPGSVRGVPSNGHPYRDSGRWFPFDFGFMPVQARLIGVIEAEQTQEGKTIETIAVGSRLYAKVNEFDDLPPTLTAWASRFANESSTVVESNR